MSLHSRQGDLLFLRQDTLPAANLKARQSNVAVVGEATGHAHHLQAGTILEAPDGTHTLDIPQATQVVHLEYRPITLEPGLWPVIHQREYHPEAIRTVTD